MREGENAEGAEGGRDWRLPSPSREELNRMHAAGQRLAAVLRAAGHSESQATWDWTPTEGWTVSPAWDEGSQGVQHVTTPEDHAGRRVGLHAYAWALKAAGVPFRWHQERPGGLLESIHVRVEDVPGHPEYVIGADYLPETPIVGCPHCGSAVPVGHNPRHRCWACGHRPGWGSGGHAPQ